MKTKLILGCIASLLSIAALSCKKTNNKVSTLSTTQTSTTSPTLNQLFADLRYTPQKLTVTAGRDTIIFGQSGTMLHFYKTSFKDATGNILINGIVELQLIEMYKPGDMIANRATTMAGGQLLQSGGQVSIIATMNGAKVYTNKYGIGFIQKNTTPNTIMTLFSGATGNADSVVSWASYDNKLAGIVAELPDTSKLPDSVQLQNPINVSYGRKWVGYVFDSASSLEYTNCDAFYGSSTTKTSVSITLPDTSFNASNTQVYLVLPDINCVMSTVEPSLGGASYDVSTHTIKIISENQTDIVPIGMKYELFVISNKNGGPYYFYQTSGNITKAMILDASGMGTTVLSDIKAKLAAL